jgi:hypothetical protein
MLVSFSGLATRVRPFYAPEQRNLSYQSSSLAEGWIAKGRIESQPQGAESKSITDGRRSNSTVNTTDVTGTNLILLG